MAGKGIPLECYPKTLTQIHLGKVSRTRVGEYSPEAILEQIHLKNRPNQRDSRNDTSNTVFTDEFWKSRLSLDITGLRHSNFPQFSNYDFFTEGELKSRLSIGTPSSRHSFSPRNVSFQDVSDLKDFKSRLSLGFPFSLPSNSTLSFGGSDTATESTYSYDEDFPLGILKKDRSTRKHLRVLFHPEEIEWRRVSGGIIQNMLPSGPNKILPKAPPVLEPGKDRKISETSKPLQATPNKSKRNQLSKEWKLKCAIQRDQEAGHYNMRQTAERRFKNQDIMSRASTSQQCQNTRDEVKILIIGAGLSGLSAAHWLLSQKFKRVQILEALDRVGGRIHSVDNDTNPGNVMELGVPGIHHLEAWNTAFTLASRNGLIEGLVDDQIKSTEVHTFYGQGTHLPKVVQDVASKLTSTIEGSNGIIKRMNNNSQSVAINLSYRDYVREVTRRLFDNMSSIGAEQRMLSELSMQMSCHVRDALYRLGDNEGSVAVQHLASDTRTNSLLIRLARGMSSLLQPLMKYFKKDTVKFNSEVKRIDWRSIHAGKDRLIKVTCIDGRVFTAHHVIITVPLGHLKKQARNLFQPPLSESKLRAIENLGFGSVSKVFLHYSKPFWSESFKFLWTDDIEETHDLCSKKALKVTAWADDTVIEASTVGTYLDDVCDAYLRRLLTSVLASYLQKEIPEPDKITRGNWSTNPLFGGTHPIMSKSNPKKDIEELAVPIYCMDTPILLFAGDATHNNYACLTHAARASGLREAQRIDKFYDSLQKYNNTN